MKYDNVKDFCEKFNEIMNKVPDETNDEDMWIYLWETMYAIAIIKDVNDLKLARRIGDRLIAICEEY